MKIKSPKSSFLNPATWAALSAPLWMFGTQLDKPWAGIVFGLATLCSVVAILLKSPAETTLDHQAKAAKEAEQQEEDRS